MELPPSKIERRMESGSHSGPRRAAHALCARPGGAGGRAGGKVQVRASDPKDGLAAAVARRSGWGAYCLAQECSRADRALPHQDAPVGASHCQSEFAPQTRFLVRSVTLLSRPDLAQSPTSRGAQRGEG